MASRGIRPSRTMIVLAAVGFLLLAGCGNGGDEPGAGGTNVSPTPSVSGDHNQADVDFATEMIPHHRQALEMAALATDRAANPKVKDLAARIEKAQDPEIALMSGWLRDWDEPVPSPDGMQHGGDDMPGMMSDEDMASLESASGKEFDRMFLEMMIRHHEGAIDMAEEEQRKGANPEAKRLARSIAESQAAEVKEMRSLLDAL